MTVHFCVSLLLFMLFAQEIAMHFYIAEETVFLFLYFCIYFCIYFLFRGLAVGNLFFICLRFEGCCSAIIVLI